MKIQKIPTLLLILVFITSMWNINYSSGSNESFSNSISTMQTPIDVNTGAWYRESLSIDIRPEGDINGWASLEGYPINIGTMAPDSILSVSSLFLWGGFHTSQNRDPYSDNTWMDLNFRTNDPTVAEEAGWAFINLLNAQAPFSMVFQGSNGYDQDVDGVWTQITQVSFGGHVDWINMLDLVNASIPRGNGGVAATIDPSGANDLSYWAWNQNDGTIGISIGLNFHDRFTTATGGHSVNLNDFFHTTEIMKSSISASDLNVNFWLPDVTSKSVFPGNTSDTTLTWDYHPSDEAQNLYHSWSGHLSIYGSLSFGAAYANPIILNFDYTFVQWTWQNRDQLWWVVDQRGFDRINVQSYGKDRMRLTPNLGAGQPLMDTVLDFSLDYREGNNLNLWVNFNGNGSHLAEFQAIGVELQSSFGIDFGLNTSWGYNDFDTYHIWQNDSDIPSAYYWLNYNPNLLNYDNFVRATDGFNNSAMFANTSLSYLRNFNFQTSYDWFGLYDRMSLSYSVINDNNLPGSAMPNLFNATTNHFVDLTNPNYLGWVNGIPWNNDTYAVDLYFESPFDGDWQSLGFAPDTNNGWMWDSGRNWWMQDVNEDLFNYNIRIYSNNPLRTDENGTTYERINSWNVTWNYDYKDWTQDIDDPWMDSAQYRNTSYPDYSFYDYQSWPYFDSTQTYSGSYDVVSRINDWSDGGFYWDPLTSIWQPKFPNSGINAANISMFRTDAPVDHPAFKLNYPMSYNSSNSDNTVEFWQTTVDTTELADGEWQMFGEVVDNAGNHNENFMSLINVNNFASSTPATITLHDSPKDYEHVHDMVRFNFTVTDSEGIFAVIAWKGLGGWVLDPISSTIDASGNTVNEYSFLVDTIFEIENRELTMKFEVLSMDGIWSDVITHIVIDNVPRGNPPTIDIISAPADGDSFNASLTPKIDFKVNVTDDFKLEYVRLYVGPSIVSLAYNASSGSYETTLDISAWQPGNYSWYISAKDLDENSHTVQTPARNLEIIGLAPVKEDAGPPTITILDYQDDDVVSGVIDIKVDVTDDLGVQSVVVKIPDGSDQVMSLDTGDTYLYSLDTSSYADGVYTLEFTATDVSLKTTTASLILEFSNGRTASGPELGLPGFEIYMAVFAVVFMMGIIRRRKY